MNQSSVEAVEQAQQKQEEAEKQARQAEYQAEREKKRADVEIQRARRKAKSEVEDMKERQFFWDWGYLCVIFFSLIQNGAFQSDVLQLIMLPVNWCREYVTWFEQLDYMGYSTGEVAFERIFSSAVIMAGIVGGVFLVWGGIEWYRKIWDDIYKMVLIASFSFIAVLGNLIREYLPFNLLFVIFHIRILFLHYFLFSNIIEIFYYKVKYQNEEEIEKIKLSEEIIKEPVDRIVQIQKNITSRTGSTIANTSNGNTKIFKVTAYCSCAKCCGKTTGITASGTKATAGRTIATSGQFAFGTKLNINGQEYTVEDRGGAIQGNRIDVFMNSHAEALAWGVKYLPVTVVE